MTEIIAELLDQQEILKYLTGIADVEEESGIYDIDPGGWINAGENAIAINERRSERCLIKYELWNGQPPPLGSWDRTWSGDVRFASGRVFALSDYDGDTYGEAFDLGRMGHALAGEHPSQGAGPRGLHSGHRRRHPAESPVLACGLEDREGPTPGRARFSACASFGGLGLPAAGWGRGGGDGGRSCGAARPPARVAPAIPRHQGAPRPGSPQRTRTGPRPPSS